MPGMSDTGLQALCERGQVELIETRYLQAAQTLKKAEEIAWEEQDFDTLARLYLPLQEARRQIRQRCGEGVVKMHLFPRTADEAPSDDAISHGQLLVGGWGSIAPAEAVRRRTTDAQLYVETFLAAIYPLIDGDLVVVIAPLANRPLAVPGVQHLDSLQSQLPPHCLMLTQQQLPPDFTKGNSDSFAAVMGIWEKLHLPFLSAADQESDPIRRMQAYRLTLQVDPACELAHQHLADVARDLARDRKL